MKIFMPTYGGGHVNIVIPVAMELEKLGAEVIILGLSTANFTLEKKRIKHKKLQDYLFLYDDSELKAIRKIGNELAIIHHNSDIIDFEDALYYYGIGMYSLILEKGEAGALSLFNIDGRKAFIPYDFFKRVLEYEKPDVVTSTCNVRYEKAAIERSNEIGIETYFFCDFLGSHFLGSHYKGLETYKNIFCINEFQSNMLIENGIKKKKIHVIGQPAFDTLFKIEKSKFAMVKELNIVENNKIILWICSEYPSIKGMLEIYMEIKKTAENMKDHSFIIKVHPNSNANYFGSNDNIVVVKNYDIQRLIVNSDIIIGTISTAVHEAIILGKQIIIPNFLNEDYGEALIYYNSGSAMLLEKRGNLVKAICTLLYDNNCKTKFLSNRSQFQIKPDGAIKAAQFILKKKGGNESV